MNTLLFHTAGKIIPFSLDSAKHRAIVTKCFHLFKIFVVKKMPKILAHSGTPDELF